MISGNMSKMPFEVRVGASMFIFALVQLYIYEAVYKCTFFTCVVSVQDWFFCENSQVYVFFGVN